MEILQGVIDGSITVKELSYDGVIYKKKDIPIEEHKSYLNSLKSKAEVIDAAIYKYLFDNVPNERKSELLWAYDSLFYVLQFYPELMAMEQKREIWYQELTRPAHRDQDDYNRLCANIADFEQYVRSLIQRSKWDLLRTEVGEEQEKEMIQYALVAHNTPTSISSDEINMLFRVVDILINMHKALYTTARKTIGHLMQMVSL